MDIEKEREAFEAWFLNKYQYSAEYFQITKFDADRGFYTAIDHYNPDSVNSAWVLRSSFDSWQAAKAPSVMEPSIDLTGHDIKRITHFMCYEDPENLDTEVTIQVCNSGFSGAGLYAWVAEYPGEGGIKLSESPQEQTQ